MISYFLGKSTKAGFIWLVFLFFIDIIYSQTSGTNNLSVSQCNSVTPSAVTDCYKAESQINNKDEKCCYLEGYSDSTKKMCLDIPKIAYVDSPIYKYNGVLYKIQCNGLSVSATTLSRCAIDFPTGTVDCSTASSYTESCCYSSDDKKCYLLGAKYQGKTVWNNLNLDCISCFLNVNLWKISLFLLLSLFLM